MRVYDLGNMTSGEKTDMIAYFEQMLVAQAVNQHLQNDEDLGLKGGVVAYEMDRENECLLVKYENGELWQYRCIDCGAEGMLYKLVEEGV